MSYIQITTTDGRRLYTDWDDGHAINKADRLRRFHYSLSKGEPFTARRSFIQGAPEYECVVFTRNLVSLSLVGDGWEGVLDEGQVPVYLYEDEIRSLINATNLSSEYTPAVLSNAIAILMESLEEQDEGWH